MNETKLTVTAKAWKNRIYINDESGNTLGYLQCLTLNLGSRREDGSPSGCETMKHSIAEWFGDDSIVDRLVAAWKALGLRSVDGDLLWNDVMGFAKGGFAFKKDEKAAAKRLNNFTYEI